MITALFNLTDDTLNDIGDIATHHDCMPFQFVRQCLENDLRVIEAEQKGGCVLFGKDLYGAHKLDLDTLTPDIDSGARKYGINFVLSPKTHATILKILDLRGVFDHATVLAQSIYREKNYLAAREKGLNFYTWLPGEASFEIMAAKPDVFSYKKDYY